MASNLIGKEELMSKIKKAKKRVRILGVLAFDLQWEELREHWFTQINSGSLKIEIICEAENYVSNQSIIAADRRISGESRSYELGNFINILSAPMNNLRKYLIDHECKNIEPEDENQCFSLRTCYLYIPVPTINIDDDYYITLTLTKFNDVGKYEKITEKNNWYQEYEKYFKAFFESDYGAKKYSTEFSKKGNRLEVIQTYNEKRHPMGMLPRDSFSNTKQVKLVVWGLIFTRDGKLLIHQRKVNAKDNRGMWDKSVGGHVDINDIDTAKAMAREMAEELYKVEAEGQGDHDKTDFMNVNVDKMVYLGEWRPELRYTMPFWDVNNKKDEYFYFRFDYPFSAVARNSERHLPDGKIIDVSVFADVYVCIASESFDISKLKNSNYRLLELYELKDCFNEQEIIIDGRKERFIPTPDLKSIIRSDMWDELSSFADYVKNNLPKEE